MSQDKIEVSLMHIANGAVIEKVDKAIREALADINDVNKPMDQLRKVILEIELKPEKQKDEQGRHGISVINKVKTKLADRHSTDTLVVMGEMPDGSLVAKESYQTNILDDLIPDKGKDKGEGVIDFNEGVK